MARARTTKPRTAGGTGVTPLIGAAAVALLVLAVPPAGAQQPESPAAAEEAVAEEPAAVEEPAAPRVRVITLLAEDAVAARVAETYGVDVLQVKRHDLPGEPAYAVKVMAPPGAGPVPFQVTTLMVDAVSGELIPQFRHGASGYQRSGTFSAVAPTGADGTALRLRTFRPRPEQAR